MVYLLHMRRVVVLADAQDIIGFHLGATSRWKTRGEKLEALKNGNSKREQEAD